MGWRIGVDSGGTFTDICLYEEHSGRLEVWKVPSTPADPSRGIAASIAEGLARVGSELAAVNFIGHGTTVATNALIELKGARTAVVVSDGFRDLLEIGRQKRPSLYDLRARKPPILVPRERRYEVAERLDYRGQVERALDLHELERVATQLNEAQIEAVAVCFLYGFLDPRHERLAEQRLSELLPDAFICTASEVAAEFREYERLSTTVVNAYLGRIMQRYIARLHERMSAAGARVPVQITQSNGGVLDSHEAARLPVRTILSGPSTGVVAAQAIGHSAGIERLITFDVGGTSSDVALLDGDGCKLITDAEVHGYPIKAPMLDIHTVGAGGGSIASLDAGGLLKVGPRSAGADPGPACYGKGNLEATVTDANVVLGTLNPSDILGGRMKIQHPLAVSAIERLAAPLGLGLMETAQGVLTVLIANMAKAIRLISVQRGRDPRDYVLIAFGGAGPLHAARLAAELGIRRILVPPAPGALCALGLLLTDLRRDFAATRLVTLDGAALAALQAGLAQLEGEALRWCERQQIPHARRLLRRRVDLRYLGQNYELVVELPEGACDAAMLSALGERFAAEHLKRYGFVVEGAALQLVTIRIEAIGRVEPARFAPPPSLSGGIERALTGHRQVWFEGAGGHIRTALYSRERLNVGDRLDGPAIIEQMDTTTLVLPGMQASVDAHCNLNLEFI